MKTTRVNLKLPESLHKEAKATAAQAGKSLQDWIENLIASKLKK